MFSEMIKDKRQPDEAKQHKYLNIIVSETERLTRLINNVLDFSRMERRSFELERTEFDLRDELESMVDLYAANAGAKSIELLTFIDPQTPPVVIGDPVRLRQVLANILDNAFKFTPEGGEIELQARLRERTSNACRLWFSVRDSGIGIASSQQRKVFDRFWQADTSTTRAFGGSGGRCDEPPMVSGRGPQENR